MRYLLLMFLVACLTGCGATHTAINKRHLDVQTKTSASIFLDPVTRNKRTVFVQIRNTSDRMELDLEDSIRIAMKQKGYTLAEALEEAHYLLQTNILQVGRSDLRAAEHILNQGFGAALGGGVLGGLAQREGRKKKGVLAGSMVGATVATVTDAMVQDVVYSVVADVQVSERVDKNVRVKAKTHSRLKQGIRGVQEITATQDIEWLRYQTRVVSTANKVNLKFELAVPELVTGLTRAITGVF